MGHKDSEKEKPTAGAGKIPLERFVGRSRSAAEKTKNSV